VVLKVVYGYIRDCHHGHWPLSECNKLTAFRRPSLPPFSEQECAVCKVSVEESKGGRAESRTGKESLGQTSRRGPLLWGETNNNKGQFDSTF
jgi:hypothetical protein